MLDIGRGDIGYHGLFKAAAMAVRLGLFCLSVSVVVPPATRRLLVDGGREATAARADGDVGRHHITVLRSLSSM
jgi:hypothetical protein